MAISSVLAIMSFADFGIGNGVMNLTATAHGKNDTQGMRQAVSSGFAALMAISAFLIAGFFPVYRRVDWAGLFNVHSPIARAEAGPALLTFALVLALNIPVDLVQRTQMGLQQGFRSNLWQLTSSIAGLIGVLAVVHWRGGLPALLLAYAGAPLLFTVLNGAVFFGWSRRDLRPALRFISWEKIRKIGNLGFLFFVLQLACALAFSSDNFIIARVLGPEAVTQYAIPQRMFMMISLMLSMFTAPLWPAYAEAISRGDIEWVRKTLFRSLKLAVAIAAAAALVLVCGGQKIVHLWVGNKVHPSLLLLAGFGVWALLDVAGNAVAMFLNGASIIRFQVIFGGTFGAVCLLSKFLAVRYVGTSALPWTTTLTYTVCVAIPTTIAVPRLLVQMRERRAMSAESPGIFG
jgi:O-antigen/teichoic acid export membrane protein